LKPENWIPAYHDHPISNYRSGSYQGELWHARNRERTSESSEHVNQGLGDITNGPRIDLASRRVASAPSAYLVRGTVIALVTDRLRQLVRDGVMELEMEVGAKTGL
jgi:hypothetical protein